jgi:hypothetical protein
MKYFAHPDMNRFKSEELDKRFAKVVVEKPKESRSGEYWPAFSTSRLLSLPIMGEDDELIKNRIQRGLLGLLGLQRVDLLSVQAVLLAWCPSGLSVI